MSERGLNERELASLAFSCVRVDKPLLGLRAFQWHNTLLQLGTVVPFWLVHDLGMLMVVGPNEVPIGTRPQVGDGWGAREKQAQAQYIAGLKELAESEMMESMRRWSPPDDVIAILLIRILSAITSASDYGVMVQSDPFPMSTHLYEGIEQKLPTLVSGYNFEPDYRFLFFLMERWLSVLIAVEQVDLDTLKLLGIFGLAGGGTNGLGLLDLLEVMQQPEANDVVNFSLDLLPSVLETKRSSGQQTYSVDGYSGVSRKGSIDSMVFSELAFDDDLFARRFAEREIYYYAREKQRDEARRLHYLVIDASASMRGQRNVFARGLALTLVKKLLLAGDEARVRFFDSTLYEEQRAIPHRGPAGGLDVAQLLSFKGEHGRNYAKVFALLSTELRKVADREGTKPVLYILTHGECHIPLPIVQRMNEAAHLYGIYMLPSMGELDLEYLPLLDTVQVVEEEALYKKESRESRALSILDDATREG